MYRRINKVKKLVQDLPVGHLKIELGPVLFILHINDISCRNMSIDGPVVK